MFSTPTTIVLGAGASWDYGLPLGRELWERIVDRCTSIPNQWDRSVGQHPFDGLDGFVRRIKDKDPAAAAYLTATKCNDTHEKLRTIADTVMTADVHFSVDEFLRDHPSLSEPIQILIAGTLFERLYGLVDSRWKLKSDLFALKVSLRGKPVDNWIRYFAGLCRPLLVPPITRVKVISFNYDRLFETLLRRFWESTSIETKYPPVDACFEFLYPHGTFASLPLGVSNPMDWIREEASRIQIAGRAPSETTETVRVAIKSAEQVFMIGFSCARMNEALLQLERADGSKVFAQNYLEQDQRLLRTFDRLNVFHVDKAPLSELVSNGFFEQLYRQGT